MPEPELSRREFCRRLTTTTSAALLADLAGPQNPRKPSSPAAQWDTAAMDFLEGIASATVRAAHVAPGAAKTGGGINTTGIPLITPGGNYPAFWIRDFAMSLDCGLVSPEEILPQLKLIALCQNGGRERKLRSGAIIPPYSIPDHIRLDGKPVFYPGTYSSGEDQGGGVWGPLPPADDHFYFLQIAYAYWRKTQNGTFLTETVGEHTLLTRLIRAFYAPEVDQRTGAVVAIPPRRAVGFGFDDSIYMLGAMSFATLLRWQAARQLVDLCQAAGEAARVDEFLRVSRTIKDCLTGVFCDPASIGGWLRGATQRCRQPDVWATLFAIHLGILPEAADQRARATVTAAVRAGHKDPIIEYQAGVRHVPTTHDFSAKSAWEGNGGKGTYQNGAYWHTPTGWLIEALYPADASLAQEVFARYIAHLKKYDFRNGSGGAPWECFGIDLQGAQNPVYMTSATLPLAVLRAMRRR